MSTNYEKVIEFHDQFDIPVGKLGFQLSEKQAMLRVRLMLEELAELIEALQMKDYENAAKEVVDLLYTVYGTGAALGIPVDEVFEAVHLSNMTKSPNPDSGGKILKGLFYRPPNIEKALRPKE